MSIQARLTGALLLLVVLLLGGTTWALYLRTQEQFTADFDAEVRAAQRAVERRLERDAAALKERVAALSRDPRLDVLLQDLAHGRYDSEPERQKAWLADAAALRRSADLDTLWILDGASAPRVLAAAHRVGDDALPPAVAGYVDRGLQSHVVVKEPVERAGRPVVLSVLASGVSRDRLVLVGGRVVGQGVAEDLRLGGAPGSEVSIRDRDGEVLASTLPGEPVEEPDGYETAVVNHRPPGQPEAALAISVHVSRAALEGRLAALVRTAALIGGVAALLAIFLSWLLARRITRPLRALAEATRRIAAGERDLDLPPRRRDEVGDLVEAFSTMVAELDESELRLRRAERVAAWQDIARELAHEIKNPLTPIRMAIETVRRTHARKHPRFEEVFEESTATILEEVDRLKNIVTEFSQFARLPQPTPRRCRLNDLVHQAVVLYREQDGVTVTEALADDLGEQHLDPERMAQVIQNLLKNALQATAGQERPGEVRVSTHRAGREVVLTVEDNGCGIHDEDMPRVFTPYFTSKSGGTGLGLAVVHRIVSGHGGRVTVSSTVGQGTRFEVRLPADPPPSGE